MSLLIPIVRFGTVDERHRPLEGASTTGDVVQVHRFADDEIAVGVEPAHELVAVVVEVALDLELLPQPERVAELGPIGEVATEPLGEGVVAAERDLGDLSRDRQTLGRPVAGFGVVVVAAAPPRVRAGSRGDRSHPMRSAGHSPACKLAIGTIDRTRLGYVIGPLEHLHPAHRPADHRRPLGRCRGARISRACARTMSRIVTTGNRDPYGSPSSGCGDAGPVEP